MTIPVNLVDILFGLLLILAVPPLVGAYLQGRGTSRSLTLKVCIMGVLWVIFGLISEELLESITNFQRADSFLHQGVALRLLYGMEPNFFDELPTGNKAYQAFLYGVMLLGAQVSTARAINAFCGLWGGLILANYIKNYVVWEKHRELLLIAVIFFPSTIFWTSNNMKEGFTYLGICLIYSAIFSHGRKGTLVTPGLVAGTIICGIMRPHMAFAWLISVGSVAMLTRGRRGYALIALAALPLLFWKMQSLAQYDISSVDSTLDTLKKHSEGLRRMGGAVQTGPQIPVLSGILAIFFRPFIWESRSVFMAICGVEIWTLTLVMLRAWLTATPAERRFLLRIPAIRVAFFIILIVSVLFSYLPNDGLLARQRVQVVPALMIITMLPLSIRSFLRNTMRSRQTGVPMGSYPPRVPHQGFPGAQLPSNPRHFLGTGRNRGAPH